MLFSVDHPTARVSIHAAVPDAPDSEGLKAGDWLPEAAAVVGGKGGGSPTCPGWRYRWRQRSRKRYSPPAQEGGTPRCALTGVPAS